PAGVMTHFHITAPAGAVAGTPFPITFQALDDRGNPVPGYVGPVHLTVTDGPAVLARDYTLTGADAGAHPFTLTLPTPATPPSTPPPPPAGPHASPAPAGTPGGRLAQQAPPLAPPADAVTLRLSAPATTTAGQAVSVSVTLVDAYGNVATGYTGTVRFASSDA